MKTCTFQFPSATGVCEIHGCIFTPDTAEPSTVLAIHHGMAEHMERYIPFCQYLTDHGVAVFMHDMASHGKSACPDGTKGWFGEKDGYLGLVKDFRTVAGRAREMYPDARHLVMGHSMGSFICRMYLSMYPEDHPDGAVIMGTGGPNPAAGAGLAVASLVGIIRGKKHQSSFINEMAFGSYGKRFEGRTAFDWLTRDKEIVDRYVADPMCGYLFTVQGMHDLVSVNQACNTAGWFQTVPKDLPILLISGEEDPVGNYGSGVREVAKGLTDAGCTRVSVKLYPGCRHEVLNETNRKDVMEDVLAWIMPQGKA